MKYMRFIGLNNNRPWLLASVQPLLGLISLPFLSEDHEDWTSMILEGGTPEVILTCRLQVVVAHITYQKVCEDDICKCSHLTLL